MNPCPGCGSRVGHASIDLIVGMHAHELEGLVTCERHGAAQPIVALTELGGKPVIVCRACWTEVYATMSAFMRAAVGGLRDHNAQQQSPPTYDLGAILANVAAGNCWCGAPYPGGPVAADGNRRVCTRGHSIQVHHFDGRPPP